MRRKPAACPPTPAQVASAREAADLAWREAVLALREGESVDHGEAPVRATCAQGLIVVTIPWASTPIPVTPPLPAQEVAALDAAALDRALSRQDRARTLCGRQIGGLDSVHAGAHALARVEHGDEVAIDLSGACAGLDLRGWRLVWRLRARRVTLTADRAGLVASDNEQWVAALRAQPQEVAALVAQVAWWLRA